MPRPTFPTLAQVQALPLMLRKTIPETYQDINGHMNIQYYYAVYDEAGMPFFAHFGITDDYFTVQRKGIFDLEHHVHYLAEVHVGDTVAVHSRLLGRTAKRVHGIWFLVNETRQQLANTFEFVSSHADLEARRTSPFGDELGAKFDTEIARHTQLDWDAPISGIMKP
ncbi:MAG: thioesterase family protein [Chloroflexota bacterium]